MWGYLSKKIITLTNVSVKLYKCIEFKESSYIGDATREICNFQKEILLSLSKLIWQFCPNKIKWNLNRSNDEIIHCPETFLTYIIA